MYSDNGAAGSNSFRLIPGIKSKQKARGLAAREKKREKMIEIDSLLLIRLYRTLQCISVCDECSYIIDNSRGNFVSESELLKVLHQNGLLLDES
jgi:hypothetical protein